MKLWLIALAVYLLLTALLLISNLKFESQNLLLGLSAGVAGILIVLGRDKTNGVT